MQWLVFGSHTCVYCNGGLSFVVTYWLYYIVWFVYMACHGPDMAYYIYILWYTIMYMIISALHYIVYYVYVT